MAIIITDQYKLRQANFLDDRIGLASSVNALKSWDFEKVPIPEGFEVYVGGIWYIYNSSHSVDPILGKFRTRNADSGIDEIVEELRKEDRKLEFDNTRDNTTKFSNLLDNSFWEDEDGVNHARPGRIVTVTNDSENNGPWYLINSDYTSANSWIKLLDRTDIEALDSSDTKIYGTKKADSLFPKKEGTETISGSWTFVENSVFTKNLSVNGKTESGSLDVTGEVTIGGNTSISGNTDIGGNLDITKNSKVHGNSEILGSETIGGDLSVTGKTDIGGNLKVSGNTEIDGSAIIQNNVEIGNDISISGNSTIQGNELIEGDLEVSGKTNITGDTTIQGNTEIKEDLTVLGNTSLGDKVEFNGGGSVENIEGESVATFDKIVVESGEIGDLDDQIVEELGMLGVENLLKNTRLQGQYDSKNLENETKLYDDTRVYSDIKEDWNITTNEAEIIPDSVSITGYSFYLSVPSAQISQYSAVDLIDGENYVLSWKQKGTLVVSVDNYDLDIKKVDRSAVSGYDCYYARFIQTGTRKTEVKFSGGPGYVCEISLEEGIVPISWRPSLFDTDPVAKEIYDYEYLKTAFSEYDKDGVVSSLFLKNQIKVGECINGEVENVKGGLSGVFSDDKGVIFWSGSSYTDAQTLAYNVIENPNYFNTLSYSEIRKLAKAVITLESKSIFTDLYAYGKMVGEFRGTFIGNTGETIENNKGLSGILVTSITSAPIESPVEEERLLVFRNGKFIISSFRSKFTSTFFNDGGSVDRYENYVFNNEGLCGEEDGEFIVPISGWKPLYNIRGQQVRTHYLYFSEGYLVKVSTSDSEQGDNSIWY